MMRTHDAVIVYFDGSCALCRHEIAFYRRRSPLVEVAFQDLSCMTDGQVADDLSWQEAMAVLHVRGSDGELRRGVDAFLLLWGCYPGLRLMARLGALPGARQALEIGYKVFLRWRAGRAAAAKSGPCMGGEECMPGRVLADDRRADR